MKKTSVFLGIIACFLLQLHAAPQPGEVWREYHVVLGYDGMFRIGGKYGGEKNLDVNYPLAPYRVDIFNASKSHPPSHVLDLEHAIKAEVMVGYNQSHSGNKKLYIAFNNHDYQLLPWTDSIRNSGYFFHIFPTIDIPLNQLQETDNVYKFTNENWLKDPANYDAGIDQGLVYEMVLRVYYDPALKPHPTGAITSPSTNGVLDAGNAAKPVITATAADSNGNNVKVDFIGYYYDHNRVGDTELNYWRYRWSQYNKNKPFLELKDIIGTDSTPPYQTTWDMKWIPNQPNPMKLSAFVTGSDGIMTMLPPVENVQMVRDDRYVEVAVPTLTPSNFKSSAPNNGRTARFEVFGFNNSLRQATDAKMYFQFWPGGGNNDMGLTFNGTDHYPTLYPEEPVPIDLFQLGVNELLVDKSEDGHHGMELHWPGISFYIAYDTKSAPSAIIEPADSAVLPGENATFSARIAGIPEPSYQWQKRSGSGSWQTLAGETGSSLTLISTPASEDESQYRVVATNASGTFTSRAAELRVSPILPSFQPVDGIISMEAEHFDSNDFNEEGAAIRNWGWMVTEDHFLYSGDGFLWNYFSETTKSVWGTGGTVNYRFRAELDADYIAWIRVRNVELDSTTWKSGDPKTPEQIVHLHTIVVGYNGVSHALPTFEKLTKDWQWAKTPVKALAKGEHTLNIMRGKDGLMVDKIVITSDPNYNPASVNGGFGPDETPRDIAFEGASDILFPRASTIVKAGETLTLQGVGINLRWTVGGVISATGTGPNLEITIPETAPEGSELIITLEGDIGTDTLTLPIVLPPKAVVEQGGMVVMEAEEFLQNDQRTDVAPWTIASSNFGFVGTGYLTIPDTGTVATAWADGAMAAYDVVFETPGTYTFWMRILAGDGDANSAWFGRADVAPTQNFDNSTTTGWTWIKGKETITIPAAGRHTFHLINREDGYSVDRILLTTDSVFTPSGDGPAKSPQEGGEPADPYTSWSSQYTWPNPAASGPTEDPDMDGVVNIWEMFKNTEPLEPSAGIQNSFELVIDGGSMVARWTITPSTAAGFQLELERSNDLNGWTDKEVVYPLDARPASSIYSVATEAESPGTYIIEAPISTESPDFFRFILSR